MNVINSPIIRLPFFLFIYLDSSQKTIKFKGCDKEGSTLFEINSKLDKSYWLYGCFSHNNGDITTILTIKNADKQMADYHCKFDLSNYECSIYKTNKLIAKTKKSFLGGLKIYNNIENEIGKYKGFPFSFNINRTIYSNKNKKLFTIKKCQAKELKKQNIPGLNYLYKVNSVTLKENDADLRFLLLWAAEFTADIFDNSTYEG